VTLPVETRRRAGDGARKVKETAGHVDSQNVRFQRPLRHRTLDGLQRGSDCRSSD
jgi:hypothetical protein